MSEIFEKIQKAYKANHKLEKGRITKTLSKKCGLVDRAIEYRIAGKTPLTKEQEKIFLEVLNIDIEDDNITKS